MQLKNQNLGLFFGLSAGFLWSFTFLVPKVLGKFSSTEILLSRYIVFCLISLCLFPLPKLFTVFKNNPSFLKEAIITTILGFTGYYFILVESILLIGVPIPSFIMGLVPVAMILSSGNLKKNIKSYRLTLICVILGMIFLTGKDLSVMNFQSKSIFHVVTGIGLAFTALASWSYFALRNVHFLSKHPEISSKDWSSILGVLTLPITLLFLLIESAFRSKSFYILEAPSSEVWFFIACIILLGGGASWVAMVCWNKAGSYLSKEMLGLMIVSETSFAVILNVFLEKRMIYLSEFAAIALLSAGVLFASKVKANTQVVA